MLIVGVLIGVVLGGFAEGDVGALIGAMLGGLAASFFELRKIQQQLIRDHQKTEGRLHEIEKRLVGFNDSGTQNVPADAATVGEPRPADETHTAVSQSTVSEPSVLRSTGTTFSVNAKAPPGVPLQDLAVIRISPLWNTIQGYFTGGNILVRVGIIVLFFGVAFLLKYAAERNVFPIELRLLGVAVAGLILLMLGLRMLANRRMYALALQGGGLGMLYLTGFTALRLYHLLSPGTAFGLFVLLGGITVALAVRQNAVSLAILGVTGAFLAPVLASTGSGSHIALFSYYAVLNLVILAIIWFKPWRFLGLAGFLFTFIIGMSWGHQYYQPHFFASTEPFVVLFFLIYVGIAVLLAVRQPILLKGHVEGTLIFGTPVVSFALQAALVHHYEYGLAWSSLALGIFYLLLASLFFWKRSDRLLAQVFLAIGAVFATLTIPFALDDQVTSAIWAVEGAALVWIGIRQRTMLARISGIALQIIAALYFLDHYAAMEHLAVINAHYMGAVMISLAAFYTGYLLAGSKSALRDAEKSFDLPLIIWGELWWFGAGLREIDIYVQGDYRFSSALIFIALSCLMFELLGKRFDNAALRYPAMVLIAAMAIGAAAMALDVAHPFAAHAYIGWIMAFAVYYWALRRQEQAELKVNLSLRHAAALWLLTALLTWEIVWAIDMFLPGTKLWPLMAWAWVAIPVILLIALKGDRMSWPVARHYKIYLSWGGIPIISYLVLWSWYINRHSTGDVSPLPYMPLLNPLDLTQIMVLLALAAWIRIFPAFVASRFDLARGLMLTWAALALFWISALVARSVHHWADVPFHFDALVNSVILQAALSLLWTLGALGVMVFATHTQRRFLWLTASGLLAAVIVKLFFVDLANTATVARIVSFLGVGSLLLVIGYFSPVPPREID